MKFNMRSKRFKTAAIGGALAAALAVGGTFAYFTDGDTAANEFSIGSGILIDLQEPSFDEESGPPNGPKDIIPNQEIAKDPQVANEGSRDAYVFLAIDVPVMEVETAAADGTVAAKSLKQLFEYDVDTDNWTLVTSGITGGSSVGSGASDQVKITNAKGSYGVYTAPGTANGGVGNIKYLYAYTGGSSSAMKKLQPKNLTDSDGTKTVLNPEDYTTPQLFPAVRFINLTENDDAAGATILEGKDLSMPVTAYAIQADFIDSANGDNVTDGTNAENDSAPATVWGVIQKQNADILFDLDNVYFKDDTHRANEDPSKDLPETTRNSEEYANL